MLSLTYDKRNQWVLWRDTGLVPILFVRGSFRDCWKAAKMLELRKMGVYMHYER